MSAAGEQLRSAFDAIPGAREAFIRVLRDPETAKAITRGAITVIEAAKRAKEVGILVAVAEIEDREVRLAAAKAFSEAIAGVRQAGKTGE